MLTATQSVATYSTPTTYSYTYKPTYSYSYTTTYTYSYQPSTYTYTYQPTYGGTYSTQKKGRPMTDSEKAIFLTSFALFVLIYLFCAIKDCRKRGDFDSWGNFGRCLGCCSDNGGHHSGYHRGHH